MDADRVFSSGSNARSKGGGGLPAPLDGEIILPNGRAARDAAPPPAEPKASARIPGYVLMGVAAATMLGLGAGGGYLGFTRLQHADRTALILAQVQHDLGTLRAGVDSLKTSTEAGRQDESIRGLKKSVDVLKAELETVRNANSVALGQLGAKVEKASADPTPKLTEIASRLDRIERQVSSPTPTGSIAPPAKPQPVAAPAPQPVAAQPAEKPPSKPAALGNWIVRDVYDGIALVEGRSGGIREVTPGEFLPGAGEVRSIERRGRNWIVITSRGVIDDSTW